MADDIVLNIREKGAAKTARATDSVGRSITRLDRGGRRAAGGLRLFTRASTSAAGGMHLATGAILTGGAALTGGLLLGLKRSSDAWAESRRVAAQTQAVIKSTGGVAHITARDVDTLATSLSRKTAIDDEAIASSENLLLTFTKIGAGSDIFKRATTAALDLSAAGFGSISSTSKQLGKALNDPIKGITALNRSGVTFTQTQKDQITAMVESGNLLGAQKTLLREVERQVKGSAAAQATPLKRLGVSWENIQETIGKGISPAVDALADKADHFLNRVTPEVDALGGRLTKLFGRNDLDLEDKLRLGSQDVQRTFRPYERELRRELGAMHLGDRLAHAFDAAAPALGSAAARSAPKVAGAFIGAWWNLSTQGKLITMGLLGLKVASFTARGLASGLAFRRGWIAGVGTLPAPIQPTPTKTPGGKGGGKGGFLRKLAPVAALAGDVGAMGASVVAGGEAAITGKVPGWVPVIGGKSITDPVVGGKGGRAHARPAGSPFPNVIINLDGKTIAKVTHRNGADAKARR